MAMLLYPLVPLIFFNAFVYKSVIAILPENEGYVHRISRRDMSPNRPSCEDNTNQGVDTSDNLRMIHLRMKSNSYDAYIVPRHDEHQSEFISEYDNRLRFISGFSGSAGTVVVLRDKAALWTDGRYFIQAEQELDCNWLLMKQQQKGVPTITSWLMENLKPGSNVSVDSKMVSYSKWLQIQKELEKSGIELVPDKSNIIDEFWNVANGRPTESVSHLFIHDAKYSGTTWQNKIQNLREILKETRKVNAIIITALDEVAWLFNLRGGDVPFTPIFKSYAFVSENEIRLYVNSLKLTDEVRKYLDSRNCIHSNCVQIKNYTDIMDDLKTVIESNGKIEVPASSSFAIVNLVPKEKRKLNEGASLVTEIKAIKNSKEIEGMKNANIRDGVAIVDFISMMEKDISAGGSWNEMKAATVLKKYRQKQDLFHGESFETIAASGSNAAIIHYTPKLSTNNTIDNENIFLLDSGGQYLDGTTDITRTFHFGQPSDFEKDAYTRVLKGAIELMTTIFPDGTTDYDLDILARLPLFRTGLDYLHGTGHGIGVFLAVHEAPIIIGSSRGKKGFTLKPGMFMSDEPGYYEDGKFGIRLETVMMVVKAHTPHTFNNKEYYTFEPVTFVPFEPKLININMLTIKEKKWLNQYNVKVRNTVGVELERQRKERGLQWLLSKTKLIPTDDCTQFDSGASRLTCSLFAFMFLFYTIFVPTKWPHAN